MQLVFFSRVLEAIFRRLWLYVGLLAVFAAIGAFVVSQRSDQYRSIGIVRVSGQSTLSEITRVGGNTGVGYETPAAFTAREINAVIGTDLFISSVAEAAGITDALESGLVSSREIQEFIWASSGSDLLVEVNASAANPEFAQALATATISAYLQLQIDDSLTAGRSTEAFLESLLAPYQTRVDDAQAALETFVNENPGPADAALRPVDEQAELTRLSADIDRANAQLTVALTSLADARLITAQTETDVSQRLRVIDPPKLPSAPESGRRDDAITIMMFLFVGAVLASAAAVATALLDRSVRYPDEAESQFGLPVLASVPKFTRLSGRPLTGSV